MADTPTPGALAPSTTPARGRPKIISITPARRRRNHGVFMLGRHVIGVYSGPARSDTGIPASADRVGTVSVTAGHGPLMVTGTMKPEHARALARALHAAANAAELAEVAHG